MGLMSKLGYSALLGTRAAQNDGGDLSSTDGSSSGQFSDGNNDGNDGWDDDDSWWWSPTGMAVRYTVIIVLFLSLLLFFLGGYYHARRRMAKGLPLLPYHAWMVRTSYRQPAATYFPSQQPQYAPHHQDAFPMTGYQHPPPAYNPYMQPPPAYQPPQGASKAMADQNYHPPTATGPNGAATARAEEGEASEALMTPPAAVRQ